MADYYSREIPSVWSTIGDYRVIENVLLQWLKWRYRKYGPAVTDRIVVQQKEYGDGFNVWAPEALGEDEKSDIRRLKGETQFVPPSED